MHRLAGSALALILTLSVVAAAWSACTGEQNAHAQMKCCAAAHHQCGKSGTPADCCKQMRDWGPSATASTAAAPHIHVPVVWGVVQPQSAPCVTIAALPGR